MFIEELFAANGGVATRHQLLTVMSRGTLMAHIKAGALIRVWRGVYALTPPDTRTKLVGLDLIARERMVACLNTAAQLYGFDTEQDRRIHVLDPGVRMRPVAGLMVHQRTGAPLTRVQERLATAPAWTAFEVARTLRRQRVLAILDAALRSDTCTRDEIVAAIGEQKGRRGIVNVRELIDHADRRAESPMESEARLVMIDGGVTPSELQYEIVDMCGDLWRVDFAWPDALLVAEYDSMEWHANPIAVKRDRIKTARLQECGYSVLPIVVDDVRRDQFDLVARIRSHLNRAELAS